MDSDYRTRGRTTSYTSPGTGLALGEFNCPHCNTRQSRKGIAFWNRAMKIYQCAACKTKHSKAAP